VKERILVDDLVVVDTLMSEPFMMLLVIQVNILPAREAHGRLLDPLAQTSYELTVGVRSVHHTERHLALSL